MAKNDVSENKLVAETRDSFGKGAARRLRASGRVPAVLYGHGADPQHISLPGHETSLILRKANALLDLDIGGKSQLALVKDVQRDPVRQVLEHLDLLVVRKGEKVHVEVPIHVEGEPFSGTMVILDLNTVRLEAEATNIPENIVVNVEGAEEGHQVHASDLELPEGAVLLDEPDALVLNVIVPLVQTEDEEAEAAEGEAAEEAAEAGEAPAEESDE